MGEVEGPFLWGFVGQGKLNACLLRIFKRIINEMLFKQLKYDMHIERYSSMQHGTFVK